MPQIFIHYLDLVPLKTKVNTARICSRIMTFKLPCDDLLLSLCRL